MRLIVNADDFGISKAVNLGILEAHKNGVISSTSMICNMEAAEHGAELLKDYPNLGVGIQFVLTSGFPLAEGVDSLVDEIGRFRNIYKIEGFMAIEEFRTIEDIRKEFRCQMDKFLSFGIEPTHINSRHHIHGVNKVFEVVKEFALEYNIPVRALKEIGEENLIGIKRTEGYTQGFYGDPRDIKISPEAFISTIEKNKKFESLEIMCHPGYLDQELLEKSAYAIPRLKELATLTSDKVKKYLKENKIQLVTFKDII